MKEESPRPTPKDIEEVYDALWHFLLPHVRCLKNATELDYLVDYCANSLLARMLYPKEEHSNEAQRVLIRVLDYLCETPYEDIGEWRYLWWVVRKGYVRIVNFDGSRMSYKHHDELPAIVLSATLVSDRSTSSTAETSLVTIIQRFNMPDLVTKYFEGDAGQYLEDG